MDAEMEEKDMMKTTIAKECPEELVGQIIDLFEDHLSQKDQTSAEDADKVHITGESYDRLSDALRDTLEKWCVL